MLHVAPMRVESPWAINPHASKSPHSEFSHTQKIPTGRRSCVICLGGPPPAIAGGGTCVRPAGMVPAMAGAVSAGRRSACRPWPARNGACRYGRPIGRRCLAGTTRGSLCPARRNGAGDGRRGIGGPVGACPARPWPGRYMVQPIGCTGNGAAGTVPGITAPGTVPPSMVPPDIVPPIGGTILGGTVPGGTVCGAGEWCRLSAARYVAGTVCGAGEWCRLRAARYVAGTVCGAGEWCRLRAARYVAGTVCGAGEWCRLRAARYVAGTVPGRRWAARGVVPPIGGTVPGALCPPGQSAGRRGEWYRRPDRAGGRLSAGNCRRGRAAGAIAPAEGRGEVAAGPCGDAARTPKGVLVPGRWGVLFPASRNGAAYRRHGVWAGWVASSPAMAGPACFREREAGGGRGPVGKAHGNGEGIRVTGNIGEAAGKGECRRASGYSEGI